ncbi:hypothetical protein MYAM1_001607 [Malassezia yamatoensis]|uniref:Uncharacterized protein n=1 Tax=Malassezia yamatoensis TaxID=253288 RepID=A0AAJ5YYL0_9BASI|nr:hypothetical protein MYAM1_001607 [Malassezia yamatoensis]
MAQATPRHRRVEPKNSENAASFEQQNTSMYKRPSRLRPLLIVLALTTFALLAHQFWRMYGRSSPLQQFHRHGKEQSMMAYTDSEDLAHMTVPESEVAKDRVAVQFDEDGEIDLATMQRMLDILYKKPQNPEGYSSLETEDKNQYRFLKQKADIEE